MSIESIKASLEANGLKPNKALGQNFLADDNAAAAIATDSLAAQYPVLEIGSGLGALTKPLLARSKRVVAVEIDAAMVRALEGELAGENKLTVLHEDFQKCDMNAVYALLGGAPFVVAANLPYYVTTPICMKLLSSPLPIRHMTLMLQREAAERFTSKPKSKTYTPLTVLANHYYDVSQLMALSPSSYYPQPEVDSVVMSLSRKDDVPYSEGFDGFINSVFSMRRKTLANNLKALGHEREAAEAALCACSIPLTARAEELLPEKLLELYIACRK